MFSTRQLPSGSPVFDKVFPTAVGFGIGCAISSLVVQGNPEFLVISSRGIDHPLFTGGALGFGAGMLLSPLALWFTRKSKSNKGILGFSIVGGLFLGFAIGMVG